MHSTETMQRMTYFRPAEYNRITPKELGPFILILPNFTAKHRLTRKKDTFLCNYIKMIFR